MMKSKEVGIREAVRLKNSHIINYSNYESSGPDDLEDWLLWARSITKKVKRDSNNKEEFLKLCKEHGLSVSNTKTFLNIYWGKKIR